MKQVMIFSLLLFFSFVAISQNNGRTLKSATVQTSVKQMATVPVSPDTTRNHSPKLEAQQMGSWYSGIYTSTNKIDGIVVTKTFKVGNSVADKYQTSGNGNSKRPIESSTMGKINVPSRNLTGDKNGEKWDCLNEDRRITLDDQGYLTLDIASQITKVYPGKAFHFENYNNGSWRDIQENRRPFRISCSSPNINGSVVEDVNDAREGTIRQAVANIYNRFPTDPAKVANLTFTMYAQEIHNQADMSVRIGAGGYGFGFSANNLFSYSEKSNKKTFLVDITKTLFTIDAEHPDGGLFTDASVNTADVMYMASVTYGIRILASIELDITDEKVLNSFEAKYEGLLYGGYINADLFASDVKNQATVKFYVVGGMSNAVSPAFNIADMQKQITEMTKTINYNTCQPIRYAFKNNAGEVVSYRSATDWFKYRSCDPPGENKKPATLTVRISEISLKIPDEDDVDLYGGIWANVYKSGNRFLPPAANQYDLLKLSPELHLKSELIKNGEYRMGYGRTVTFNFDVDEADGAVLYVYFNLMDEDDSPDDPIVMPNLSKYPVKNNGQVHDFYALKINLNDIKRGETGMGNIFNVDCTDNEGDYPFTIGITVTKK